MNKIIHLSLARKSVPIFMDIVQGTTAPAIEFILDDYTPPANARARIYIKKEGGEVYNNCTLSGNVVTYTPTAGSFDVAGQCVAQLEFVQSSTVIVSWRIFVTVEPNLIMGSAAPASTEFGALTQLIQDAQKYDVVIAANNITGANNRFGWTALISGQDLNSITTPGVYGCNNTVGATLLNSPTVDGIRLEVRNRYINNTANVYQRITLLKIATWQNVWQRFSTDSGSSWTDWVLLPRRNEVNAIANRGGKNLLDNFQVPRTVNGVTLTRNDDRSVTLNGTATAQTDFVSYYTIPTGSYIMTGTPQGGSSSTYYLSARVNGSWPSSGRDYGDGATLNGAITSWAISIASGVTLDNVTFYPMIRDASIQDDTYVPYGLSNAELTEKAVALGELASRAEYKAGSSAGTYTYTLESGRTYLVSVAKANDVGQKSSLYLVACSGNNSNITPIIEVTSNAEVSITGTTLTVTTKTNYNTIGITCIA